MTARHGLPSTAGVDLLALTPSERTVWDAAYTSGYCEGHEAGVRWADDQAAALWRTAAQIVHAMAELPEVDPQRALEGAARREQRWSA